MLLPKNINMKRLPAYTLIEMLIVLTIFVILSAFSFSAFDGLRDTVTLNEDMLTLEQDIRWAQRSALFLERGVSERWVYGIGIDFSDFEEDNVYRLIKWCSQYDDFGSIRTRSMLPNFDPAIAVGLLNGNLPAGEVSNERCSLGDAESKIVRVLGRVEGTVSPDFEVNIPDGLNAQGDVGGLPVYVIFEAVSGRMFMYDSSGNVVNYNSNGQLVTESVDFVLEVTAPRTKRTKTLKIDNVSGKISVESREADE